MNDTPIKSAVVLGAGGWGTALASLLAERGLEVTFWGRDLELMERIRADRENTTYLPGVKMPESVRVTAVMEDIPRSVDMALIVVPSKAMAATAGRLQEAGCLRESRVVVSCAKGIELQSGRRMSEIVAGHFPQAVAAVLTGPNHAEEVGRHLATAAVVACADEPIAVALQEAFTLPWFRTYRTDDVAGAEWGGALKNPYAIAAGIAQGLKLGDNALAALVTRALAEMVRFGVAAGGRPETFQGLSGVGDLMATCFSDLSRNHRVGIMLGEGRKRDDIIESMRMVAEGVPNTESLHRAARKLGVRTPLLDEIFAILYEDKAPVEAMRCLLERNPRPEVG
jgi:glycerol-3-phosphate dehydrogenase (NAD(P)+)